MSLDDEWNQDAEERAALRLVPIAKELMDHVKSKVPEGTHFGLMILVPPLKGQQWGRVIAMTTDREVVAPQVAQWAVRVMEGMRG